MAKIIFLPVSILSGLLAGAISKRLFRATWGAIDSEDPPRAQYRHVDLGKLALALAIDGALVRLVKGLVDHGSRRGFHNLTGAWPGKESPGPKK